MKGRSGNINRRSFVGRTGQLAAGLTLFPRKLFIDQAGADKSFASQDQTDAGSAENLRWWEKEPLRIIEFEEGFGFREKAGLLKGLGANMEHLTRFTDTSPGTSFLDAHNLFKGKKVSFSTLKEYLSEVHTNNIRVVIYYNVHAIEINYARKHPEWQQIKDDGKPIEDVYSVDSSFCINSPWREEVFSTLRKLAAYEIDGVFYDGPIFFPGTCRCESCKSKFRQRYQKELPFKGRLTSGHATDEWKELIEFQSDSIALFLRESNKILKEINPGILLYMNGNTLAPSWPTGRENRKIIRETDILGAEGGFLYGEFREPIYKPGAMAKLLETQAGGKPTVVFDAAKQGPWSFSTLPRGEISILYSQTITGQGNVWLAMSDVAEFHVNEIEVIRKFNKLIKENPGPFFKTESMAKIALLWPQRSGNFYTGASVPLTDFTKEMNREKAGNTEEEFYGFYDGLARGHFPFDVLDEEALNGDLKKYNLIIFPNATCLGKTEVDKIKNFVREGGNIISTFETSRYDENGKLLDDFGLKEVLGAEKPGNAFGPLSWDYVLAADDKHFSLNDIRNKYIKASIYGLKSEAKIKAPLVFCKPLPGSYSGSPEVSEYPFLVENKFGKGKSIYIAGTFGASLYKFHFPEYYKILFNLANELSKRLVWLENAPSSVEVNIRKKGRSVFVYLINFTSEMKRPVERIIPVAGIKAGLVIMENVRAVKALLSGEKADYKLNGNSVIISIPVLNDYEVLEIELN